MISKENVKRGLLFIRGQLSQIDCKTIDGIVTSLEEEDVDSPGYKAFEEIDSVTYDFEDMIGEMVDEVDKALKVIDK